MTDFQLVAIPRETFARYLDDPATIDELPGARWLVANAQPGFPCRVSLRDAAPGENVLAMSYEHHATDSPYRAKGPVFIRASAQTAHPAVNEIPKMFEHRLLSLRAYDRNAMMIDATTTQGTGLASVIRRMFSDQAVDYIHIHNAGPGCFSCAVHRVE